MTIPRRFGRLNAAALARFLELNPQARILDARDAAQFEQGHLPDALRLDGRNHERMLLTDPKDRPVVIYCYHGNSSQTYAQMFVDFGFESVHDLIGGYEAWKQFLAQSALADPKHKPLSDALAQWLSLEGFQHADARGAHGNTPLMQAAWRGDAAMAAALLDHGVSLDATNGDGNNALWFACVHGDPALITLLVHAGVPIDHRNDNGATCLMYGASASKPVVVHSLLDLGADTTLVSLDGFSALDMAASIECLHLLRHAAPRAAATA